MKPLISVIVAVYNVEKYLKKCVDSLLEQTYTNLEIILVDDGSKDNSPKLCDAYKEKDKRIVVIHKENGGAGEARNFGLNICRGIYISFIDGDDSIDRKYFEELYGNIEAEKADISICSWEGVTENQKNSISVSVNSAKEIFDRKKALELLLYQEKFDSAVWCKLYKRELWEETRFPKGNLYEDLAVIYLVFAKAQRVVYSSYTGYFYLCREDGVTLHPFSRKKMELIEVTDELYQFIKQNYKELELAALSRMMRANFHIYMQIPKGEEFLEERKKIERNIKQYRRKVICDKKAKRGTKIALLITYLGFKVFLKFRSMKGMGKN